MLEEEGVAEDRLNLGMEFRVVGQGQRVAPWAVGRLGCHSGWVYSARSPRLSAAACCCQSFADRNVAVVVVADRNVAVVVADQKVVVVVVLWSVEPVVAVVELVKTSRILTDD